MELGLELIALLMAVAFVAGMIDVIYFLLAPRMGDEDRHSRAGAPLLIVVAFILGVMMASSVLA